MDSAQLQVIDWSREALRMALLLGGPAVLAALVIGVVVGIVQTLTQMQEPVVGLVPRIVGVILVVLLVLPWLLGAWVGYASEVIVSIPEML
jgi:flagellar biosynthesis protein FliQ